MASGFMDFVLLTCVTQVSLSLSPNLHQGGERPKISLPVSLYLLSQVRLIDPFGKTLSF